MKHIITLDVKDTQEGIVSIVEAHKDIGFDLVEIVESKRKNKITIIFEADYVPEDIVNDWDYKVHQKSTWELARSLDSLRNLQYKPNEIPDKLLHKQV